MDGFLLGFTDETSIKQFKLSIILYYTPKKCLNGNANQPNKVSDNFIETLILNNNTNQNNSNIKIINCFKNKSSNNIVLEINLSIHTILINRQFIFAE